ncbi:STAS domain-containing protein [Streptomyces sp. NPDC086783]|uniref:STAS domain-containing protein n=1 Tax=Streptomyces sp. NPDC086783 TaxID=3365758 RepID=UPI00382F6496
MTAAPDGTVREVNRAAAAVFPGAAPGVRIDEVTPGWFTAAHRRLRGPRPEPSPDGPDAAAAHGPVGERSFAAHPVIRGDGAVAWWFVDETAHRLADAQLRTERQRTAFLVEASTRLLSSLNLSRVMDVTARLAAEHLADAALVVAPAAGRRHPVTYCVRGGTPVRAGSAGTPADVPGLEEALQGFPPVPSRWIDPAASPGWVVPPGFGEVGSMVVTPLPGHGVPAGALILLRRSGQASFDESEELFARLLAARAGAALFGRPDVRRTGVHHRDADARTPAAAAAAGRGHRVRGGLPPVRGQRADRRGLLRRAPRVRYSAGLLVTAASRQLADHPGTTELRLDCADITSCDAMGLSALLMVRRLAGEAGARIRLEGGSVCLDRLLEVTGTREHLVAAPAPVPGAPGRGGPARPG